MSSRYEIIGTYCGLKRPSFRWKNADGTETIIGLVELENGDDATIKGTIYPGDLIKNLTYRFYGYTKSHEKYGDQFCFDSFAVETPSGEDAIVAYLTQCKGIGPVMARAIYNVFENESVRMLREQPGQVSEQVPRLTNEIAVAASSLLKESEKTERSKIDLLGLLKGKKLPRSIISHLINDYGVTAANVVRRNPYVLMQYKGCGFAKADKLYLSLGLNPVRMKRQALCAWNAIAKQGGGDTWFPFYVVKNALREEIASADVDVERAMQLAIRGKLLSETYHKGQRWVAEFEHDRQETMISELLAEAENERDTIGGLWLSVADELDQVTDHQRENARDAMQGFVGVLAGRPGTGKTYTVARIVMILQKRFGQYKIAIAAPTGKAAVRATAAMAAAGLHVKATTLHTLLGFRSNGFEHNRDNPLPHLFIVVDEASMIDTAMMAALLSARDEGSHVLFVGDPHQLAPVGHGAPLRDFIAAGVPCGELIEIQRNSGRIVKACGEIIDRSRLTVSPKFDEESGENLLLMERAEPEDQIETLVQVFQKYQKDRDQGKLDSPDPIWDLQVIVAVNDKSPIGRKPLNKALQDLLNPDGERVDGNPFRVADKIINTKNSQYKLIQHDPTETIEGGDSEQPGTCYVANGEQAEVLEVAKNRIVARLTFPDRTILIPRGSQAEEHPEANSEESGTGCNWELAYAISGHKSQGSEWPIAIVMIDDYSGARMVQSKQWLYTAISRAKRLGLLIGKYETANACCGRDALFQRKTFLAERIAEIYQDDDEATSVESVLEIESDEVLEVLIGQLC